MINNQTFQLNVAMKTSIIGDNHEGSKKENKITGYSKKKLSSAIPCDDIIACSTSFKIMTFHHRMHFTRKKN